jgi:hypothetical protein
MTKINKTVAEALEILTSPGAVYDPYEDGVKEPEIMQWITKDMMKDFAAANPAFCRQSSAEEIAIAFMRVFHPTGTYNSTGTLKVQP